MKVSLIAYTPEPEKLVATAARLCYSNKADIETISNGFTEEEISKFINQLLSSGHMSPFEHCSFTFGIEGISRVVSHELVRHRIGVAISQRSQRYCSETECNYIFPPECDKDPAIKEVFEMSVNDSKSDYYWLTSHGVAKEIARYVLPNAIETRMIVTMNARELMHFFNLRCCAKAQPEMQKLAKEMLAIVRQVAPVMFKNAGPSCISLGYCPEGSRSCGRVPTIEQLKEKYNETR